MRVIYDSTIQIQHQIITKLSIPFINIAVTYIIWILRIIAIIYHIYIECELYNLAYVNIQGWIYEQAFSKLTMVQL